MTPAASERHPYNYDWRSRFPEAAPVVRGEGAALYAAEDADTRACWLISDEGSMADFADAEDLDCLVALTRYPARSRAQWVADIAALRQRHERGQAGPAEVARPVALDYLIRLAEDVARRLEDVAAEKRLPAVNERDHLQQACERAAASLAPAGRLAPSLRAQMAVTLDVWPRLGGVDLALRFGETDPPTLVELKSGHGNDAAGQCAWDAAKLALALQRGVGSSGFLLAAAPAADWARHIRGTEFFADGPHDAVLLRVLYGDWWRRWEREGYRPHAVTTAWRTRRVHTAGFDVAAVRWELRLAEVTLVDGELVPWPPLAAAGGSGSAR